MTTTRVLRDQVENVLDYLVEAELAIARTSVSETPTRVSWHPYKAVPFLQSHDHLTIAQYRAWVEAGHYSCVLFDGSLLQITYDVAAGEVAGHRLAYVPCPMVIDLDLIRFEPLSDVIEAHEDDSRFVALRSPTRFDFDLMGAKPGHPAAHLTFNSVECRIACVAPMHVGRFVDFVFRNFYGIFRAAHASFFDALHHRHLGERVILDDDRFDPHIMWNLADHMSSAS